MGTFVTASAIPTSRVTYAERYLATNVSLAGVSRRSPHAEVGTSLVDRGTTNLGNLSQRFLIDVHGLDDKLTVQVNGAVVVSAGFNQVKIYEVTQRLRSGANKVVIKSSDNNNGSCWHFGYRVGDGALWRYADNYANTACPSPLPRTSKTIYQKAFTFNFSF